jgi:hypothetical protein
MWGLINAIYFIIEYLIEKKIPRLKIRHHHWVNAFIVFIAISFSWIFFRADSLSHAVAYITGIFNPSFFTTPQALIFKPLLLAAFMIAIEWVGRNNLYALENIGLLPRFTRWCAYLILIGGIGLFAVGQKQFIYFQF